MSGHKYIKDANDLFGDDDVDDDTFVNSYRPRIPPPAPKTPPLSQDKERKKWAKKEQTYLEKQREIQERTLESSYRSIGLLRESENIGIATAEELARQRESLENTSMRLENINMSLTTSQKHLNGIKSIYFGFKNFLSGKTEQTTFKSTASPSSKYSKPGPSSRSDEGTSSGSELDNFRSHPTTHLGKQIKPKPMSDADRINMILDDNLDEMVGHIGRLKGLGQAIGAEIHTQNNLIDEIATKADTADMKMTHQNKQMKKLLN